MATDWALQGPQTKSHREPLAWVVAWAPNRDSSLLCSGMGHSSCTQKVGAPVNPCPASDLDALFCSAGRLHSPPGLLQWTTIYSPFYLGGGEEAKGNFIQTFLPQSNFKKHQSQKRMRRNKQHTFLELRHPDRDRQAGRPSPTPGYRTPCSHSSPGFPACLTPLGTVGAWRQAGNRTLDAP